MSAEHDLDGLRPYQPDDLPRLLRFVGERCALTDFCGCLHPGDVCHAMSNALRGRDLDRYIHVYEDADGSIKALVVLHPVRYSAYDLLVDPSLRDGELETRLIAWGERAEWRLVQQAGSNQTQVTIAVMDCDGLLRERLLKQGYQADAAPVMMVTTRALEDAIPPSVVPEGFSIRSVSGEHEAARLSETHSSAFGSKWTPDEYVRMMRTPGFEIERELVVVAPDGRFAAFLIYWLDPVTQSGLFEPVGCHADFRRRGLTRALMYEGMRRMAARGMTSAIVLYHVDNAASTALYRSVGFAPKYTLTDFRKTMQ
ncbi:MAG: GNAT family N-acetyltransferase [Chloroflexota bacterium]